METPIEMSIETQPELTLAQRATIIRNKSPYAKQIKASLRLRKKL